MRIAGMILAAVESTRMGSPKPLLPWGDGTLIEYLVTQLYEGGASGVVVVLGHAADDVRHVLRGLDARIVVNPEYKQGRASSTRAGAAALPVYADGVMVVNVDQPRPAEVVRAVLDAHQRDGGLITVPTFEGQRGHPTVFGQQLFAEMVRVTEQNFGMREIMQRHRAEVRHIEVPSPWVVIDTNTPEEYERARALAAGQ
ncbi:MAG: nucleotidyltransferase family protein [Chloroflexi bacterium]|nr:nucleotidyltransferase family protein [Chloroflexota bacterium]